MGFWARIVIYTTRLPPSVPSVANSENEDSNIYIECTKVLLDINVVGGLDSAAASYRIKSLHSIPASSSNHPTQPSHLINNIYTTLHCIHPSPNISFCKDMSTERIEYTARFLHAPCSYNDVGVMCTLPRPGSLFIFFVFLFFLVRFLMR